MKNFSVVVFSIATFLSVLSACQNKASEETPKNYPLAESKTPPSVLSSDNPVTSLMLQMDQHTWQDLDKMYREELPNYRNEPSYENLRKIAIYHLVKDFQIDKNADDQTIIFYTKELSGLKLIDPVVLGKLAGRLKGVWTDQQIRELVTSEYNRNVEYAKTKLPKPEQYFSAHGENWEKLKKLYSI